MQVVAEDASLDDRLHLSDAIGRQVMGLVKRDLAVVGLAEDAVEDDEVVMRVDVEGGAEAMKEADGSELGVRRRSWARAPERGTNRAQQDLEYGTGDANVVVKVRTQAFGDREHPLPCGHVWQHVVGEVRGDLAHAASVAGGANASALARERDQPLVATVLTAPAASGHQCHKSLSVLIPGHPNEILPPRRPFPTFAYVGNVATALSRPPAGHCPACRRDHEGKASG